MIQYVIWVLHLKKHFQNLITNKVPFKTFVLLSPNIKKPIKLALWVMSHILPFASPLRGWSAERTLNVLQAS